MGRRQTYPEMVPPQGDASPRPHIPGLEPYGPPIDAAAVPDLDKIEKGFKKTLEDRENLDANIIRAFHELGGTPAGVYLPGAEGNMLFQGFGNTREGVLLNAVARAAVTGEGLAEVESQTRESLDAE